MKVLTGEFKHKKLYVPNQRDKVRMSPGVVKEAVIDIYRGLIEGSRMLDIFSGSGAVGIEFLSNHCEKVVFIDSSKLNTDIIKRNLSMLGVEKSRYEIINRDFRNGLRSIRNEDYFDFIYIDPPYFTEYVNEAMILLSDMRIFKSDVVIITEHHKKERVEDVIGIFTKKKTRKYGSTVLNFWQIG